MEIAMDEYQKCVETRQRGGTITLSHTKSLRSQQRYANAATPELLRQLNNVVVAYRTTQNNKRARIEVTKNNNSNNNNKNTTSAQRNTNSTVTTEPAQQPKKRIIFDNGTFPFRLHEILDTRELRHLISWQPHGRAWKVHNPEEFAKHLSKYFPKQTKYASFIRQVNMWSFTRIASGPDEGCYYHQSFSKRNPMLCREMVRKRSVPRKKFQPDFYKDMAQQQSDRR